MNPHDRAVFLAKHMNYFLEKGYRVLIISLKSKFLNIYREGRRRRTRREFDNEINEDVPGIIEFHGIQESYIVDFVVKLVVDNNITTEPHEEDMNDIVLSEANDYYEELQHKGRIEGQMYLQRFPTLMPKDIRKKIGEMTGKY